MEAQPQNNEKKESGGLRPLRTYQSDVEELLKNQNASLAKIAIAEAEKKATLAPLPETATPPTGRSFDGQGFVIVSIIVLLVLGGIGSLGWLVYSLVTDEPPPSAGFIVRPIISSDSQKEMPIGGKERDAILKLLRAERERDHALSSITTFYFSEGIGEGKKLVSPETFLSRLRTRAPSSLARSLGPEFVYGVHTLRGNQPFFVFKVADYQNAFAGMLLWEKNIREDLGTVFGAESPVPIAATSTADILGPGDLFADVVIKNKDARAVKNALGEFILLYSFPEKNTLIITTNENTLQEAVNRIIAGKMIR